MKPIMSVLKNKETEPTPVAHIFPMYMGSLVIADALVQKIFKRVFDIEFSRKVDRRLPFYTLSYCNDMLQQVLHLSELPEDNGEPQNNDKNTWEVSEEPVIKMAQFIIGSSYI